MDVLKRLDQIVEPPAPLGPGKHAEGQPGLVGILQHIGESSAADHPGHDRDDPEIGGELTIEHEREIRLAGQRQDRGNVDQLSQVRAVHRGAVGKPVLASEQEDGASRLRAELAACRMGQSRHARDAMHAEQVLHGGDGLGVGAGAEGCVRHGAGKQLVEGGDLRVGHRIALGK